MIALVATLWVGAGLGYYFKYEFEHALVVTGLVGEAVIIAVSALLGPFSWLMPVLFAN
jgi:hypothetical protein